MTRASTHPQGIHEACQVLQIHHPHHRPTSRASDERIGQRTVRPARWHRDRTSLAVQVDHPVLAPVQTLPGKLERLPGKWVEGVRDPDSLTSSVRNRCS